MLADHLTLMEAERQRAEQRADVEQHGYREALMGGNFHRSILAAFNAGWASLMNATDCRVPCGGLT